MAGHYEQLFVEEEERVGEELLQIGAMPFPFPSRRQIIDADKGSACLACHRMPYPTAPKKAAEQGRTVLSAIPDTHPGAWRLMTAIPHPFNK